MNCQFEIVDQNLKRCKVCGRKVVTDDPPHRIYAVCRSQPVGDEVTRNLLIVGDGVGNFDIGVAITDKPEKIDGPSLAKKALNFMGALKDFVADPSFVSKEAYEERLKICDTCPFRSNNTCLKCGCQLSFKAKGNAFHCPEKKWPGD